MNPVVRFADAEVLAKAWALTTTVAPMLTRADSGVSIYNAMPKGAALPAMVITRAGGAPRNRSDFPQDEARLRFACWAKSRLAASNLAYTIAAELDSLARTGGFASGDARLAAAELISLVWLPDPDSDTPRYIVDTMVTTLHT